MGHREGAAGTVNTVQNWIGSPGVSRKYCEYCVELDWVTAVSSATMLTCNLRILTDRGILCHYADLKLTDRALRGGGTSGNVNA